MGLLELCRNILAELSCLKSAMERLIPEWATEGWDCSSTVSRSSIVHLLLDHGADPKTEVRSFGNALHLVCLIGDESIVCRLLNCGADVNVVGGYFGAALRAARTKECTSVIDLLVARGARELELTDPEGKISPARSIAEET